MKLETKKGIITGINTRRYFGFILGESGEKIFFHATGVVNSDFTKLKAGFSVEYLEVKDGSGKRKAIGVVVI